MPRYSSLQEETPHPHHATDTALRVPCTPRLPLFLFLIFLSLVSLSSQPQTSKSFFVPYPLSLRRHSKKLCQLLLPFLIPSCIGALLAGAHALCRSPMPPPPQTRQGPPCHRARVACPPPEHRAGVASPARTRA
jgi:hypothetical protein